MHCLTDKNAHNAVNNIRLATVQSGQEMIKKVRPILWPVKAGDNGYCIGLYSRTGRK